MPGLHEANEIILNPRHALIETSVEAPTLPRVPMTGGGGTVAESCEHARDRDRRYSMSENQRSSVSGKWRHHRVGPERGSETDHPVLRDSSRQC